VANPVKGLLDTRARRINGETKHRMTVEMQGADTGYGRYLNARMQASQAEECGRILREVGDL
jgi:hypothetical protein